MTRLNNFGVLARVLSAVIVTLALAACASPEEKAAKYIESGQAHLENGEFNKANLEFRNALQLNEDLPEAWYGISRVEESRRNWNNIAPALARVVELQPDHLQANLRLGRLFLLSNQIDEALEYSNTAYAKAPDDPEAIALRAAVLFRLDDHPGATAEAEKLLQADPGNIDALTILASVQFASDNADAALVLLDRGLERDERNLGLLIFKLRIFDQLKDLVQTETVLKQLTEFYPDQSNFRQELMRFYIRDGRPDEVGLQLRAIADADPDNASAGLDVVRFVNQTKGYEAARAELEQRINAGGKTVQYQQFLAELEFNNNAQEEAIARLVALVGDEGTDQAEKNGVRVQHARLELARGSKEKAQILVEEVIQNDDHHVGALTIRAAIRTDGGDFDDAVSDLRVALSEQPKSAQVLTLLARAHALKGSLELADDRYVEALRASNYAPQISLAYARLLERQAKNDRAEETISEALSRMPRNIALLTKLADFRLRRQDWLGAEEIADRLRTIEGDRPLFDEIAAAAQAGKGEFDQSMALLQNAYSKTPGSVRPMVSVFRAFLRAGRPQDAEAFVTGILDASPDNAEALVLLGSLKRSANNQQGAEENYVKAIEVQPENPVGYQALALLYAQQQKLAEAVATLRNGLGRIPENLALGFQLSGLLDNVGDVAGAIEILESLYKRRPQSDVIANNLASLLVESRDDQEGLDRAAALAARLRNSPVPQFKDTLGWIQYKRGEYLPALEILKDAAEALPNMALVHFHLGMAYKATGESENAIKELEQALDLAKGQRFVHADKARAAIAEAAAAPSSDGLNTQAN